MKEFNTKEKLDQTDLEAYFQAPPGIDVPVSVKLAYQDAFKRGFESIQKIFEFAGGCQCCGDCCRGEVPAEVSPIEIKRISSYLNTSVKEAFDEFCRWFDDGTWDRIYLKSPCPFINKDNKCDVYPARPVVCKFYPIQSTEFFFTLINNPACQLSQSILRFYEEYRNLPETKEKMREVPPEGGKFFGFAVKESMKGMKKRKLPACASKTELAVWHVTCAGLEDFVDWLERR